MRLPFFQIMRRLRASYWFVPSVMLIAAIALGALMVWLDAGPASGVLDGVSWYQKSKPEGAREMLSTIAGSMITVAGVVFSITIVAISFAASQYGPRILTNFMSDRGNQFTLGTFVATFAYAVVVLRTIHGGDSNFVPQLAAAVGLLLALCSIAVLIYFIHHVPESIQVNTVSARIGRHLLHTIKDTFPEEEKRPSETMRREADAQFGPASRHATLPSHKDGYLQAIDYDGLLEVAEEHDCIVKLERTPGEFMFTGEAMVSVAPPPDEQLTRRIGSSWTTGSQRTADEDPLFLVDELAEIAARALSPGVNDPHTANTCVDWLGAAIALLGRREAPVRHRCGRDGKVRLITAIPDFAVYLDRGFAQLRPYLAADLNAAEHAIDTLAAVCGHCAGKQLKMVRDELDRLVALARLKQEGPSLDRLNAVAERAQSNTPERRLPLQGRRTSATSPAC